MLNWRNHIFSPIHHFTNSPVFQKKLYIRIIIGDVSSVGSERMLHTHEVAGSNPARPTMDINRLHEFFYN